MPIPVVTSITPDNFNIAGFTAGFFEAIFHIQGSNFTGMTSVTIGGNPVSLAFVNTDTLIRCLRLPAHAAGVVDVEVTNASGTGTGVGIFTYVDGPTISYLNILTGGTAGETYVGIVGSGFAGTTDVSFGGVPATIVHIISDYRLIVKTPAHAAGSVDVTLTSPLGTITLSGAFTYADVPIPPQNIFVFEECCFLWFTNDGGSTWTESSTPTGPDTPNNVDTLGSTWTDAAMAINDGNYLDILCVCSNYSSAFGVVAASGSLGLPHTWTMRDPELGTPAFISNFDYWTEAISCAYSSNGTILFLPNIFDPSIQPGPIYPRLSLDNGESWQDVTNGIPDANIEWSRACFSAGAAIMYMKPSGYAPSFLYPGQVVLNPAYIFKSIDRGANWTQLTTGPTVNSSPGVSSDGESEMRLRCSSDGQHIAFVSRQCVFWWSHDGGATWSSKNFLNTGFFVGSFSISSEFADCGLSDDGQTLLVGLQQIVDNGSTDGFWPALAISQDGGATWTDISANIDYPTASGGALGPFSGLDPNPSAFTTCNISPDGMTIVVTFLLWDFRYNSSAPSGQGIGLSYASISFDAGATFICRCFFVDEIEAGTYGSKFVASYATPLAIPTPFIPPQGGYIIERLDNRVWPTVENVWAVDCGFELARPAPPADLTVTKI